MNVGLRALPLHDSIQGADVPLHVLYPTQAEERPVRFGPYALSVAPDAPLDAEPRSLVVISHGNASTPWVFRGLAAHLAREGFVVALPEHIGNSRSDNSLFHTLANLENRPRHVRLSIEAARAHFALREPCAVIGHSIGAYTALAVAGAKPWCGAHEAPDGVPQPVTVTRNPHVRALVLFAPAAGWFMAEGSLSEVDVPILMRTGERDDDTPAVHRDILLRGLRTKVDEQVVPNAGHFSFQSPFPPELVRPSFPPSQDPPGFDRAAYQPILHAEVRAFLERTLRQ